MYVYNWIWLIMWLMMDIIAGSDKYIQNTTYKNDDKHTNIIICKKNCHNGGYCL